MNKNRLFIIIAVISVLAMLIPVAAMPVSAQGPVPALIPATAHDIAGDQATFTAVNLGALTVTSFAVQAVVPDTGAVIVGVTPGTTTVLPATTANVSGTGTFSVTVMASTVGEATIIALLSNNTTIVADKKWGEINESIITGPKDVVVTWIEANKTFHGTTTINDTIIGTFKAKNTSTEQFTNTEEFRANGAVLHWYLLQDTPAAEAAVAGLSTLGRNLALSPVTIGVGTPFQETISSGIKFNQMGVTFGTATTALAGLPKAVFSSFGPFLPDGSLPIVSTTTTISGAVGPDGSNQVTVNTVGEEPVLVVVIPEYPNIGSVTQFPTVIEWTKINFWTSEMEKVPQVRWAGEKIVLEKYFGPTFTGALVRFSLENQSPGALEGIPATMPPGAVIDVTNLVNTAQTVWTVVGTDGYARCMLVSEDQGEVDVDLALYNQYGATLVAGIVPDVQLPIIIGRAVNGFTDMPIGAILNQHGFVVFYMKLESITLGNVGKRAEGQTLFTNPANPWNVANDTLSASVNVSTDDLLRARVKGWFMGDNMSNRAALVQDADPNHAGTFLYTLPAGRWVLPDDWPVLAGPNWTEMRLHWDIMNNPDPATGKLVGAKDGAITSTDTTNLGKGPYVRPYTSASTTLIADTPVIGPFRPGLEYPTGPRFDGTGALIGAYDPTIGLSATNLVNAYVKQKTVVPNGVLDWWDAPMPPAKITFELQNVSATNDAGIAIGVAGYFHDAFKTDIYYVNQGGTKVYTNPFYWEMIPAFPQIPAFVNNGGYDWDSWLGATGVSMLNGTYGPYQFWKIINRPPNDQIPTLTRSQVARDNANFPAKVQVYSDNHGEAMVFINGNYNLNPQLFTFKGVEPVFGSTVGQSSIIAIADYPYFRKHNQIVSSPVVKTWTWGGMVLGPTNTTNSPMVLAVGPYVQTGPDQGTSTDLMVFVWATDRDGMQAGVLGTQVDWSIAPVAAGGTVAKITNVSVPGDGVTGVSNFNATMRSIGLESGFLKGTMGTLTGPMDGTMGTSFMRAPTTAEKALFNKFWGAGGKDPKIGQDGQPVNPDNFVVAAIDLLDATQTAFDTVTEILKSPDFGTLVYTTTVDFSVSHSLDDAITPGDANLDGKVNMADITAIERMILGLSASTVQADANGDSKINMGDVVKAERIILGKP